MKKLALPLFISVLCFNTSWAQNYPMDPLNLNSIFIGQSISEGYDDEEERSFTDVIVETGVYADEAPSLRLSFSPDAALRMEAVNSFLSFIETDSPELAGELRKMDLFGLLQDSATRFGLSVNDLGDGAALLVVGLWEIANEEPYLPNASPTQEDRLKLQALKRMIGLLLAQSNPGIAETNARLQQASDQVWLMALFLAMQQQSAHTGGNIDLSTLTREARELGQQIFGLDLRDVDLTTEGFVPRDPDAFAAKYGG